MADYTLAYWPLPFRGEFVRAVLAHAGATWDEVDIDALIAEKGRDPADQLVPHMGPPVLTDHAAGITLAQTQAILTYLGDKYDLVPGDPAGAALTHKVIADANDVLYEMTLYNGARMWTQALWDDFRPRLARWMAMFEALGRKHGLTEDGGYLLGTEAPGLADLVAATLWGVMTAKLPSLRPLLDASAPALAGLTDRIAALPAQADLRRRSDAAYGDEWCGGRIEASLRRVI